MPTSWLPGEPPLSPPGSGCWWHGRAIFTADNPKCALEVFCSCSFRLHLTAKCPRILPLAFVRNTAYYTIRLGECITLAHRDSQPAFPSERESAEARDRPQSLGFPLSGVRYDCPGRKIMLLSSTPWRTAIWSRPSYLRDHSNGPPAQRRRAGMLRQLLAPGSLVCYKRRLELLRLWDHWQRPKVAVDILFFACIIVRDPCLESGGQMLATIIDVHNRLSYWLKKVPEGPVTITRRGKPVGVLVSLEEYERLRQVQAYLEILQLSRSLQDSGLTADELFESSRDELEARHCLSMPVSS
jgi:prevent-host-death family protein